MSREDIATLVHELDCRHIELELQNEELREAQAELVQSHQHFRDLGPTRERR